MENLYIPENYHSDLSLYDTQIAIKTVKDFFQQTLSERLYLLRVSAPLFVTPESGLNDNLNGVERPVTFGVKEQNDRPVEIVHSLAKWKRYALKQYGFHIGEGLYTDMNAIRRDEITDNIHSIYVDQWDWEKIILKKDRNITFLKDTVREIYKVLKKTEKYMAIRYDYIEEILPKEIFFITTQELLDLYPNFVNNPALGLIIMYHAVKGGDLKVASALVDKQVPLNWDPSLALRATRRIQVHGAYRILVRNGVFSYRRTPLHIAALENNLEMVRLLIGRGANPLQDDENGKSACDLATDQNVVRYLKNATKEYYEKLREEKNK